MTSKIRITGFTLLAGLVLVSPPALGVAVSWAEIESYECTYGDCENGRGTLKIKTPFGEGSYSGNFRDGNFNGYGRLELPTSLVAAAVYIGNWEAGIRNGRGTYYNGRGNLYIGEWRDDKRHGTGSYFFNLQDWQENRHTEFWLKDNYENYTGEFQDDYYHGQGTYRWASGQKYTGSFFAGNKHGFGTFYYETGTSRQQLWHYGDFVR
ncbi:MAG: hypothetical protein ACR2PR_05120 [Pseudohongiellaceae bacterium]